MKRIILAIFSIVFSLAVYSQDSIVLNNEIINCIDTSMQKQGLWKLFDAKDN